MANNSLKPKLIARSDDLPADNNLANKIESVVIQCIPSIVKECCSTIQNQQCQDMKKSFSEVLSYQNAKVYKDQNLTLENLSKKLDCFPTIAKKISQSHDDDDRLHKRKNLIFFSILESDKQTMKDQLKEDCHNVKLMLKSKINLAGDDVVKAFRLGTTSINNPQPRPFLIKFQNEGIKWKVLKVTKGLKFFKDHKCYPFLCQWIVLCLRGKKDVNS